MSQGGMVGGWGGVRGRGGLAAREVAGSQRGEVMYEQSDVPAGDQRPLAVAIAMGTLNIRIGTYRAALVKRAILGQRDGARFVTGLLSTGG